MNFPGDDAWTQILVEAWGRALGAGQAFIFDKLQEILPGVEDLLQDIDFDTEGVIEGTLGGVEELLGDFQSGITGTIDQHIGQSFDSFNGFVGTIGDSVGGILDGAGDVITGVGGSVNNALRGFVLDIEETLSAMIERLFNAVQSSLQGAISAIQNAADGVFNAIGDSVRAAVDTVSQVGEAVIQQAATIIESIRDTLAAAFQRIEETIGGLIEGATEILGSVGEQLSGIAEGITANAESILQAITSGIDESIDALISGAGSAIGAVREQLESLQGAVLTALDGVGPVLSETVSGPITSSLGEGLQFFTDLWDATGEAVSTRSTDAIAQVFINAGAPVENARRIADILTSVLPDNPAARFIAFVQLMLSLLGTVGSVPAQMLSQRLGQELAFEFPVALPSTGEVQQQVLLGVQDTPGALSVLRQQGFSENESERMLALRRRVPEVGIIQVWWLREFVDTEQALDLLSKLGLNAEDSQHVLDMSFFIPPVQDLITMAVREVFTPEIAERFGQFEDFPEQLEEHAAQQGVSPEWAQRYWAAHWALPSVQMGFEMLHRRVIDEDDLKGLLRAQDVMPFWRDKLTEISFRPLTRVDVRRMHDLGLVSDAELVDRYRDIGYSQANAEMMRDFTVAYNSDRDTENPEELERLTRTAVLGLFSDGALSETQALALMTELGIGRAAALIFLEAEKLNTERRDRREQTDLILERAQAGILSFTQASDGLGELGLEPVELQRALTTLERRRASATRLPSRANLDSMLKAGLISDSEYIQTMQRLGYAEFWAERFLQLARG